jgi:predicted methyltransferase
MVTVNLFARAHWRYAGLNTESLLILSHFQASALLEARRTGHSNVEVSPDLGISAVEVTLSPVGVSFPSYGLVSWDSIDEIATTENSCFVVEDGELFRVQVFSEFTNRLYSLMPTEGAPTMLVSGIPMHRIKGIDPHLDTLNKMEALGSAVGQVLDTATGLGYTAIEASRTADQVVTIELDPAALEVARYNPWSRDLFDNPKIEQLVGDSFDVVQEFEEGAFDRVIHDPPAFALAGDLYSNEFYAEMYRVLNRGGRLFHYIGNPESKSGSTVTRGAIRRLQEVGFSRVSHRPKAFGVVAFK